LSRASAYGKNEQKQLLSVSATKRVVGDQVCPVHQPTENIKKLTLCNLIIRKKQKQEAFKIHTQSRAHYILAASANDNFSCIILRKI
jgi:hypothetical protein